MGSYYYCGGECGKIEGGRETCAFDSQWLAAAGPARDEALSFLRFWLGSIVVHARSRRDASLPPIALVGTHKDKVPPCSGGMISAWLCCDDSAVYNAEYTPY